MEIPEKREISIKEGKISMLDGYKELTPVVYGEKAIKLLDCKNRGPGVLRFSMHWHDRMELLMVTYGSLELHTEEGIYSVCPGQTAVIEPHRLHAGFAGSEGVDYYTVMFDVEKFCNGTIASEKYLTPIYENQVSFQRIIEDEQLWNAMQRLVENLKSEEEKSSLLAISGIYEILGILHGYRDEKGGSVHRQDKSFGPILEYVNEHFSEKISAADLSVRFGYNEAYFCRRFKEITGMTFTRYVQALRMEYAQKLLKGTEDEIGTIAWKCGYGDISYFSNCFKKHCGCNPTQFRML